jgi:hypothetical protein
MIETVLLAMKWLNRWKKIDFDYNPHFWKNVSDRIELEADL